MADEYIKRKDLLKKVSSISVTIMGGRSIGKLALANVLKSYAETVLQYINEEPAADVVSLSVFEQVKWERDTALATLEEHGIGFAQTFIKSKILYEKPNRELIDRKQIRYCWQIDADGEEHDGVTLQSIIKKMPTVDAVEVVHGYWVKYKAEHYKCSICGDRVGGITTKYCSECGAKMDGGMDK